MIYSDEIWKKYVEKVESNFSLKTYAHFDPFFDFPTRKNEIKEIVDNTTSKSTSTHSFLPFVKILTKTPRFRYLEDVGDYGLNTKIRPISYASHKDSYIYGFYSFALNELYQDYIKRKGFDDCVLAYRTDLNGKCNIQFAKEVIDEIKKRGECTAIALDIKGYFDHIDHDILKEKWCKVLGLSRLPDDQFKVYETLTRYSYVNKKSILKHFNINLRRKARNKENWNTLLDLIPDEIKGHSFKDKFNLLRQRDLIVTNKPKNFNGELKNLGIPQGSSMSALLSNIYLIDFDKFLKKMSKELGFIYRRYCDDLLIICRSKMAGELEELVMDEIAKYNLTIQKEKNELTEFRQNSTGQIRAFDRRKIEEKSEVLNPENEEKYYTKLQYLGFEFDGQRTYIRSSSLSRYFRKMRGRIVKTVMMANSPNSKSDKIFRKQLLHKYSHLGKRNFLTYAYNAASEFYTNSDGDIKEGMNSSSIRKQVSRHMEILKGELEKTDAQRKSWRKK